MPLLNVYMVAASGFAVFFILAVVVSAVLGMPLLTTNRQTPPTVPPPS
jgi:energy-converting hydrogenase Eha subunit A